MYKTEILETFIIIIFTLRVFFRQFYLVVFHRSLSDSKFRKVYRTLLSILADFYCVVVWIVSIFFLGSLVPPGFFSRPFGAVLTTTGITDSFILRSFFSSLARSKNLFMFLFYFIFILYATIMAKSFKL